MNENPQVVAFANDRVRPLSDDIYRAYWQAKSFLTDYFGQGIGTPIDSEGAAQVVDDGSATDGRTQITGGDIYTMVGVAEAFVALVEADGRLSALAKIQVNGLR